MTDRSGPRSALRAFLASEAAGGMILMGAAALAMIVANSPLGALYRDLLHMPVSPALSEKLGPLMYAEEEGEVFLGRSAGSQHANVSGETAKLIDEEVRAIIDHCYGTAKQILSDNRDKLDMMAEALMKYETIDAEQIDDIMAGREPREPRDWQGGSGASGTPLSSEGGRPETPIGGPAGEH